MGSSINDTSLRTSLSRMTRPGELFVPGDKEWVTCTACGHRCRIAPDHEGICKVRFNAGGILMVPHGYVAGLQIDPIEKKPFFHVLPGSGTLSFGMLGCDYHCAYCQNWYTSQTLRDPDAGAPHKRVITGRSCRACATDIAYLLSPARITNRSSHPSGPYRSSVLRSNMASAVPMFPTAMLRPRSCSIWHRT